MAQDILICRRSRKKTKVLFSRKNFVEIEQEEYPANRAVRQIET